MVCEFYQYMRESGSSEKHMTNELQVVLYFTGFLGMKTSLLDASQQNIIEFLDSKQKDASQDTDKRWVTTWNDYLSTIKHFFRWLYNQHRKKDPIPPSEWETPTFAQIKKKKTKRLSPYSETEIWDRAPDYNQVSALPAEQSSADAILGPRCQKSRGDNAEDQKCASA